MVLWIVINCKKLLKKDQKDKFLEWDRFETFSTIQFETQGNINIPNYF